MEASKLQLGLVNSSVFNTNTTSSIMSAANQTSLTCLSTYPILPSL